MFSAVLGIERLISMLFIVRDMVLTPKVNVTKKEWLVLTQDQAKPTSSSRSYLLQYFFSSLKQLLGTQAVKRILAFFRFHPTINEIAEIKEGLSSS